MWTIVYLSLYQTGAWLSFPYIYNIKQVILLVNSCNSCRFLIDPIGEVQNLDREVKKCLMEAFKKTDEDFLLKASAASPSWKVCVRLQ